MMVSTYICLNCKTEQPKPTKIRWCSNCFSSHIYPILSKNTKSGFVYLAKLIHHGNYCLSLCEDFRYGTVIHKIHCDVIGLAEIKLHEALSIMPEDGAYELTQEQVNHIKTIKEFKDGRFYFDRENGNE